MKINRYYLKLQNVLYLMVIAVLIMIPFGCRKANSSRFLLGEVPNFGSNPGGLEMFKYVPSANRTKSPLVVVLHGCTQNAQDFADHSGWPEMADKMKFILVFPQQRARCTPAAKGNGRFDRVAAH